MSELFSYGPKNIREFIKTNLVAILYTIIFHLIILIVLVITKVQGLKDDHELGVTLDFSQEMTLEERLNAENIEVPAEWLEKVYEAREAASNRAVNVNDETNMEISTQEYVKDLLDELESDKDEEFIRKRERLQEIISSSVFENETVPDPKENERESAYTGPTTITYEFLEKPLSRKERYIFIPVYRCEGSGLVVAEITVRRDGSVSNVNIVSAETNNSPECFIEAAEKAASSSLFEIDFDAPEKHKARITYQFIAQ